MTAVWLRARSELRSGKRSLIALAILLGVIGGVVLTAAEGARRTDTAYSRFLASIGSQDAFAISAKQAGGPFPVVDFRRVLRLPQVESGLATKGLFGVAESQRGDVLWGGDFNINGLPSERDIQRFGYGVKLLAGRLPDPSRPEEIAVGYRQHPDPRMRVGDRIGIALAKPGVDPFTVFGSGLSKEQLLPPVTVRIVGTVLAQGELQGSHDVLVTPAFFHAYAAKAFTLPILGAILKHGAADFPGFSDAVDRIAPGALVFGITDEETFVDRSTHLLAISLWLFAAITALAGLLIFGQALARYALDEAVENPSLRALGMTGPQLFGLTMLRAGIVAGVGGAIAIAVGFLASPLTPFGRLARLAEPHPGFNFDALILLGAGVGLALSALAAAAIPAWRAARVRGDALGLAEIPGSARPSRVAEGLARAGLSAPGVTGLRMALQPGRGRTATPIRVTVFGAAISIAALATAFTFGSSFQHLFSTPRLFGEPWALTAGNPYASPKAAGETLATLEADPAISDIGEADIREFLQFGPKGHAVRVNVFGYRAIRGSIGPTIVDGREPTGAGEIALGAKTMHALGTSVGDRILVSKGDRSESMRIVGTAVVPVAFGPGLSEGAALTLQSLKTFVPNALANGFAVRLVPGTDVASEIRTLNTKLARFAGNAQPPVEGAELGSLRRVDNLPFLLATLLGLAAMGTLAHTLVSSVRKRRHDFAILKTLGFLRRQVSATVAWQATTIGVVSLAIGVPLGIAAGRWGWNVFAAQIGVAPEPVTPLVLALLLIPATIVFANLVAALPARIAGRLRPAPVLRTE